VEITSIGWTLAPAVMASSCCLNAAFAVQKGQTRVERGNAVVKITQQQIDRLPL
jgi:hypothetical protein